MKKVSENSINSLNEDWGRDSRNDLPYSGQAVQTFVRNELKERPADFYFDPTSYILYGFASTENKEIFIADPSRTDLVLRQTPISFSSSMYRILRNNYGGLNINTTTNQTVVPIKIDFDVQTKLVTDSTWQSTGQGCYFTLYVDRGISGTYTQIGEKVLLAYGTTFEVNVHDYISTGSNRVKVVMVAEDDETVVANDIYNILMSEIYVESFNNNWYNAIVEGDSTNYKLGGFKIVGSLQKTLHIEIYQGNEQLLTFEKLIGTSSYVDTPYYFQPSDGLDLSSLNTGVYIVKVWVSSGTLESTPISYNIMYVAEGEANTAQLVCINNISEKVYNYSTASICDYAVYNKGLSVGSPHILLQLWTGSTPTTKVDKDYNNTATGVSHRLEYTIEWLVESTINLNLSFYISIGSCIQGKPDVPIDNSAVYPAETGASLYINSTTRSNTDADRESVINEGTSLSTPILCSWTNMAWIDGIDGWTVDDENRKCLKITAGSKCDIPYQVMSGENMTFEMAFKVRNVSDYNENIITAAINPTLPGFQGIVIKPTNVIVHSAADIDRSKDTSRGVSFCDEEVQHLLIVIQRAFEGNQGKNLVTGYVNGCKNFQFSYDSGTAWENTAHLILGSSTADVYMYFCRIYNTKALGVKSAEQNYINSLPTLNERKIAYEYFNSILNVNTHEMSFQNIVNSDKNYNYFVVEMISPETVPSIANGWDKTLTGKSNFEMHFGEHPLWDFKLFDVETAGQGTTSMNYYRWNLRFRIDKSNNDKKINVAYYNLPTTDLSGNKVYHQQTPSLSKTVYFDGGASGTEAQHPALKRITAKINAASSMQSHKIGATRAFTSIHDYLELYNEAQEAASLASSPNPTVAVYEYPTFGFSKRTSAQGIETYEFIGLFTIGPDKGDKPTFGYDISTIEPELITLEGTDHARVMAEFNYPWNDEVTYSYTNQCINVNAASVDNGWEVGNCHGKSNDKASDESAINTILQAEFKPAYDVAYNNSTLIFQVNLDDETWGGSTAAEVLSNINNDTLSFRSSVYNDRFTYADMQFWIEGEYILYYYDIVTKQYVAGVNLRTDSGITETTNFESAIKQFRRNRFKENAGNYWDIQDTLFHMAFIVIFGAADNFAKNTYPYKMKTLANGGRWKWRQDDLDTLMGINNSGFQKHKYSIEFQDSVDGNLVFAGSNSVFWNLIFETFFDDYGTNKGLRSMGKAILEAMASLGGGTNVLNGCYNFIKKYFWDNAQNYFPKTAYNLDANWKYEIAWLVNGQDVDPLSQSLGDHFQAERYWVTKRLIYCMSLFKAGPFGSYSDASLGRIQFRPQNLPSVTVTPNMDLYPTVVSGQAAPEATSRTPEGEPITFNGPFGTDGETQITIQATDYLESLGDLKNLPISQNYLSDGLSITGAKLREFKIGDEDPTKVTTNVQSLAFTNTECLEKIDARNARGLSGSLDVTACTRLKDLFLEGTGVTQVLLPNGSKIKTIHFGDSTSALLLKNLKFLTDLQMPDDVSDIRTIQVENCKNQDAFSLMRDLYNSDDSAMQYIRIIWDGVTEGDVDDVSMLANIAQNIKKDGSQIQYRGINAQGDIEGNPVIEGSLQTEGIYSSDLDKMGCSEPEDYGEGLKRALASRFGTLYIIYDPTKVYMEFDDDKVKAICVTKWGSDGGLTMSQAAVVTSMNGVFKGNTEIETFNELEKFTGITTFTWTYENNGGIFNGCTALKSIYLPSNLVTISDGTRDDIGFANGATALETVKLNDKLTTIGYRAFKGCISLKNLLNESNKVKVIGDYAFIDTTSLESICFPNLETLSSLGPFKNSGVKKVKSLGKITALNHYTNTSAPFMNCTRLEEVTFPTTLKTMSGYIFSGCSALSTLKLEGEPDNPFKNIEKIGDYTFSGCTSLAGEYNFPNLTDLGVNNPFKGTKITKLIFGSLKNLKGQDHTSNYTLSGMNELEEVQFNVDDDITLGQYAFRNLAKLKTVVGMEKVVSVGISAFEGSAFETELLSMPKVTSVSTNAFYGCVGIKALNLPLLKSVGNASFRGCASITEVSLPSLETMSYNAFRDCTSLKRVTSLGSLDTLYSSGGTNGNYSPFYGCTNLEEVVLPETLRVIQYMSFNGRTKLTTINLPQSLVTIGDNAFSGVPATMEINLPNLSGTLAYNVFYNSGVKKIINLGSVTEIGMPNTSRGINGWMGTFDSCKSLESAVLPSSLTAIKCYSFYTDTALEEVTLNSDVEVWHAAFYGCTKLREVKGGSLSLSGSANFQNCTALEKVKVGGSTVMGDNVFDGCTSLATIEGNFDDLVTLGRNAFKNTTALHQVLSFPALNAISGSSGTIFANSGITELHIGGALTTFNGGGNNEGYGICYNCKSLTRVSFPRDYLLTIGSWSFLNCTALEEFELPRSLTTIGTYAFQNTPKMEVSLYLPALTSLGGNAFNGSGITAITNLGQITEIPSMGNNSGYGVFNGCTKLQSAVIPSTCKTIGDYAFRNCTALRSVDFGGTETINIQAFNNAGLEGELRIPNLKSINGNATFCGTKISSIKDLGSITAIPNGGYSGGYYYGAFSDCKNLTEIVFPSTLKSTGDGTFTRCTALEELYIPEGVTTLGTQSFGGCTKLARIDIPSSVTSIGGFCFTACASGAVVCKGAVPSTISTNSFHATSWSVNSGLHIFVPEDNLSTYKTAWSGYARYISPYKEIDHLPEVYEDWMEYGFDMDMYFLYDNELYELSSDWQRMKFNPSENKFIVDVEFYDRLVSQGTTNFNTGISYASNKIVSLKFRNTANKSWASLMGTKSGWGAATYVAFSSNEYNNLLVGVGTQGDGTVAVSDTNPMTSAHIHTIEVNLEDKLARFEGQTEWTSVAPSAGSHPTGVNWFLFGTGGTYGASQTALSVYEFKISTLAGVVEHRFVPARYFEDGAWHEGMLDLVTNYFKPTDADFTLEND